MRKFKKIAALAMAFTTCLTVNVTAASYADKPVSALTVIAEIKDVALEKEVISPGESTQLTVEWGVGTIFAAQFYSSDTNIVQIENQTGEGCTLTGVGEGTAVITVSNDVYSETVEITVKDGSDRFTYEIEDGSIVFSNYASNAMMSYVISSNIGYDYDMTCEETEAIFTPNENGKYVVTVEEYCEEIFDYSIMDGHFHYFYPVLTNYTVNVTDDEITVNREGSRSYYSEEQVEEQKNLTFDIAIDVNGNVPAPDFTLYAKGDMYALSGGYFSFLNGVLRDYDGEGRYKTYITTIHNEYKTESYFCLNAPNLYYEESGDTIGPILLSNIELAEVMEKTYTSSSMDGDLQIATPDEMAFYRVKALKDGDVTVTACFDDVKEYDLEIKDGVFKRKDSSESISPEWIPKNFDEALDFYNEYGATYVQDNIVCYVRKLDYLDYYTYNFEFEENSDVQEYLTSNIYEWQFKWPDNKDDYDIVDVDFKFEVICFNVTDNSNLEFTTYRENSKGVVSDKHTYFFEADENDTVTETDIFGWLPDSVSELKKFNAKYGVVSIHNNYAVFCGEYGGCGGYSVFMEQNGTAQIETDLEYDLYYTEIIEVCGGASYAVKVYKPVAPGTAVISWTEAQEWDYDDTAINMFTGKFKIDDNLNLSYEKTIGDVNNDGIFSVADIVMLQNHLIAKKPLNAMQMKCADMNEDGKINVIDAVLMKRQLMKVEKNTEKAVLTVETTYDGYGVMGQPLGSGEFTQVFDVAEGDILYEDEWGQWYLNMGSSLLSYKKQICKIISVDPKSITVSMEGFYINENEYISEETEITLAYGDLVNVFSKFPVDDGINYKHQITFTPIDN